MDPVTETPSDPELHLLTDWGAGGTRVRWREAAIGSVVFHLALLTLLTMLPDSAYTPAKRIVARIEVTPLVAPPFELTQPDPNKGKISKSVNIESLLPRPPIQTPRSAPSTTRPAARAPAERPTPFVAPPAPAPAPARAVPQIQEPPKIETAVNEGPLTKSPIGVPQAPPAPPQVPAEEKPKLAFETPGAPSTAPRQGNGKIAIPGSSVAEAMWMPSEVFSRVVPVSLKSNRCESSFCAWFSALSISDQFGFETMSNDGICRAA